MGVPIEVLRAAREWAAEHRHQIPDDRLTELALAAGLAAGRKQVTTELTDALADCVTKAVEYGQQDGGFVAFYLLPTGPIHRAMPLLQKLGITVRPGFDGRPAKGGDPRG